MGMCVHKRPRMQILINDVVMPNLWGGTNANKWSIEPGCTATCVVVAHLQTDKTVFPDGHAFAKCNQADHSKIGCFTMDGYQLEVAKDVDLPGVGLAAQKMLVRVKCWDRAGAVNSANVWKNTCTVKSGGTNTACAAK